MSSNADKFLYGPLSTGEAQEKDKEDERKNKEDLTTGAPKQDLQEAAEIDTPTDEASLQKLGLALQENRKMKERNDSLPGKVSLALIGAASSPLFIIWAGLSAISTLVVSFWNGDLLIPGILWLGAFCFLFLGRRCLEKELLTLNNEIENNSTRLQEEKRKLEEQLESEDPLRTRTTHRGVIF